MMNNDLVISICEMLKKEADSVIDYMRNGSSTMKSGSPKAIETVAVFNDLAIDNVEHCQKLVMKLSECFYASDLTKEDKGNGTNTKVE